VSEPTPFPWSSVPRLTRDAVRARRELVERVHAALDVRGLDRALAELLGDDVQLSSGSAECRRGSALPFAGAECLGLHFPVHGLRLWLRPEPDLWRCCVARLLDQEFQLGWADSSIDAALRGAGAALVLELARRAARAEAPELLGEGAVPGGWLLYGGVSVRLGSKLYRVEVCVALERAGQPGLRAPIELGRLGALRLRVPWVGAVSQVELAVLEALAPGDVWLPGADAWVAGEAPLFGGLLAPARSRRGMPVRVQAGRTMLGAEVVAVPQDAVLEAPRATSGQLEARSSRNVETGMSEQESELEQVVGETPVVVRLELGVVEMSAAEWAALRPGDVLASGRRLDEGVSLRTGGREIARGELVEIEGEIGVRITQVGLGRVGP
jgi:flagellar motor switch/type III secretory pathway protein FliN